MNVAVGFDVASPPGTTQALMQHWHMTKLPGRSMPASHWALLLQPARLRSETGSAPDS